MKLDKKVVVSISIRKNNNEYLEKKCLETGLTKSSYIDLLISKDKLSQ